MKLLRLHFLTVLLPAVLFAQLDRNAPSIGYVFPRGASRGDTVHVYVGGQKFNNVRQAHITGEGVELNFVKRYPPMRNLNGDQRKVLN